MKTNEILSKIEPSVTSKYSWHLYNYIKNFSEIEIYKIGDIYAITTESNKWLANIKDIILYDVVRYNYCIGHNSIPFTESFFAKYIKEGKCAIIPHNVAFLDDYKRWEYIDNSTRQCLWCGKIQHKVVKLSSEEVWEDE